MTATTQNRVGVDITQTYIPASGASTATDTTNLPFTLGTVVERSDGRRFKLVLVEDANVTAGQLLCYTTDDNGYEVTNDRAGGTSDNSQPAGLAVQAITDGHVGWIQVYGLNLNAITTDGGVAADEEIVPHATTDGGADTQGGVSSLSFGQALDADTATALAVGEVFLDVPKGSGSGGA